ncbi:MAG: ATP-binding protein [Candidatus Wallbacteria bacterium]|nr:ATP-binding protein [Candidatus Wallbacteria bacterium]
MNENENEILKEISDLKDAYFNLLSSLFRLSEAISFKFSLEEIFLIALELLNSAKPYYYGAIFMSAGDSYELKYSMGDSANQKRIRDLSAELFPWVLTGQKKVSVLPDFDERTGAELGSTILIPLLSKEKPLGIISLLSKSSAEVYLKQDLELFSIIGNQTAVAIHNALLYQTMEEKNRELGNLKNYQDNILENIENAILVTDLSGKITTFNRSAEKLFGFTHEKALSQSFRTVFPGKGGESLGIALKNASDLQHTEVIEVEFYAQLKPIPLEITVSPLIEIGSGISGFIISCRNLSQSREIERLREIDRIKSELISNVSHELRTPLTSIKAYAETMINMIDNGESETITERDFLSVIDSETERLTGLIDELLTLSQLESKRVKLKLEEFEVGALIHEVEVLVRELIKKREITFSFGIRESVTIKSDREKIKQILVNLVSNAVKYNKEKGKIKVTLRKVGGECMIKVADTGIGIPRDAKEKIFNRFFRVDSSMTYEISGTGLGLSICKDLAEFCRGRISFSSRLGYGSVFKLFLPLEQ